MLSLEPIRNLFRKKMPPPVPRKKDWAVIEKYAELGAASWVESRRAELGADAPRVLMCTTAVGYNHGTVLDSTVGLSLLHRGADVHFLACDRALPACQLMKFKPAPEGGYPSPIHPKKCEACFDLGSRAHAQLGFPLHRYTALIPAGEIESIEKKVRETPKESIRQYREGHIRIGEHAYAGALRFFARGDLENEAEGEAILRKYFRSALTVRAAMSALFRRERFDVAVIHHGIYAPQGIAVDVCREFGVRVVTWNPAYRKQCFVFSHGETYHHTMMAEEEASWNRGALTPEQDEKLERYLKSRRYGTEDWIWFHRDPEHDPDKLREELKLDPQKPVVALLSNVVWDARLHYPSNAFPGMVEWVLETIRYFEKRTDLQLVIRVHPAEKTGFVVSRQFLEEEIQKVFPVLPSNVRVVGPDLQLSTYTLCDLSNAVLIYNTKTGMEVTAEGIPTIVAGEAWIRGKGFALSVSRPEQYFEALDRLPVSRMSPEDRERARRYAYHVFFRRMIPIQSVKSLSRPEMTLDVDDLSQLAPGKDPGLDVLCEGILDGKAFVFG